MQREIGRTGIHVNGIGLGGMPLSIQGRPDESTGLKVVAAFVDGGGDFIDTANCYCLNDDDFGHNERLIAKALRQLGREDVVVATKGGLRRPGGAWVTDGGPEWLRTSCEKSLEDLGTERIELYQLHAVDSDVPIADSVGALVRFQEEGKIEHIGVSNVDASQLDEILAITPVSSVQNRCNVFEHPDLENGVIEKCHQAGITYIAHSAVGGHHGHSRLPVNAAIVRLAEKHQVSHYVIALSWLLSLGEHVLPIPGASRVASIRDSLTATALQLDEADLAAINAV